MSLANIFWRLHAHLHAVLDPPAKDPNIGYLAIEHKIFLALSLSKLDAKNVIDICLAGLLVDIKEERSIDFSDFFEPEFRKVIVLRIHHLELVVAGVDLSEGVDVDGARGERSRNLEGHDLDRDSRC